MRVFSLLRGAQSNQRRKIKTDTTCTLPSAKPPPSTLSVSTPPRCLHHASVLTWLPASTLTPSPWRVRAHSCARVQVFFTAAFTVELAVNMVSNFFRPFFRVSITITMMMMMMMMMMVFMIFKIVIIYNMQT